MKFLKTFESFDSEMSVEEIYEMLKRDCTKYLELLKSCTIVDTELHKEVPMLYRGVRARTEDIMSMKVRENRRSKDTDQAISDEIDDKFEQELGIRPRSTGVFTIGNSDIASHYGNSYLFFPIGDFKYIWSDRIADLFDELRMPSDKLYSWYLWEIDSYYKENIIDSEVRSKFELHHHEAIPMYNGKEVSMNDVDKFKEKFEEEMDSFLSEEKAKWMNELIDAYKVDEGLCEVIKSRTEITFLCDEYYIVNAKFVDQLKKLIFDIL